jgi:hypothetical protein
VPESAPELLLGEVGDGEQKEESHILADHGG